MTPRRTRGGSGAFQDLIEDHAMTSIDTFKEDRFGLALGAECDIGIGVALDFGGSSASTEATDAVYVGASNADGTRELVPFPDCVDPRPARRGRDEGVSCGSPRRPGRRPRPA